MLVFVATKRGRRVGECLGNKHPDKIVSSCPVSAERRKEILLSNLPLLF